MIGRAYVVPLISLCRFFFRILCALHNLAVSRCFKAGSIGRGDGMFHQVVTVLPRRFGGSLPLVV